nr:putative KTx Tcis15 [Tityus cisandinus]
MKLSYGFLVVLLVLTVMIATFSEVEAACKVSCRKKCKSGSGKCINDRCTCYRRRSDFSEEFEKYQ